MEDNPRSITEQLIPERGPEGAVETIREAIAAAHSSGGNYSLSIWREVRLAVRNHPGDKILGPSA